MVFITTDGGEKVGTATAWWKETEDGSRFPLVHWVAIKPAFQKKRLAKPLLSSVLKLFQHLEGDTPVFLKTQTWSHVAIQLYKKMALR